MTRNESITFLMPCLDQNRDFLNEALASVTDQSATGWRLLVGFDRSSPSWAREMVDSIDDERVESIVIEEPGFAVALNAMMRTATTPFVAILLSDDRLTPGAVDTLLEHRRRYPEIDFFHSAWRDIDGDGHVIAPIKRLRREVTVEWFKTRGCPVNHLLCWRREMGIELGGMNVALSPHGCDDYDFPWRMLEAGALFHHIDDCLYEYRVHREGPRLTTDTSLQDHVHHIESMFREHDASEQEISAFFDQAVDGYLVNDFFGPSDPPDLPTGQVSCFREADEAMREGFVAKGYRSRDFFAHRIYVAPRAGPDGMLRAQEMCDVKDVGALREILLYAISPASDDIAPELFFDKDIVWHGQQMGLPGLVATANLAIDRDRVYVTQLLSDFVQRIARAPEYRSRVVNRLGGWAHLLVNAALLYAVDAGARKIYFPTAEQAMALTAMDREVGRELFDRVYNRTIQSRLEVERLEGWWCADVVANRHRVVRLDRKIEPTRPEKTVCICHDVERGLGHREAEPEFADEAERVSGDATLQMLEVEKSAGIHVTYNLVGQLFPALRKRITSDGHALAFHSYAHSTYRAPRLWTRLRQWIARDPRDPSIRGSDFRELENCRKVDYRLPGYRATMSRITPGLADRHLVYFNFEWLASSVWSLGFENPRMKNAVVKLPVHVDDFDLHTGKMDYGDWEASVIAMVKAKPFVSIGLHDCYGPHWIPHYATFIEKLSALGQFATFDEVAERTQLASCRWL